MRNTVYLIRRGVFVDSISKISGLSVQQFTQIQSASKNQNEFKDLLSNFMTDVNEAITDAGQKAQQLVKGEVTDVHEAMIAAEKASVGLEMVVEVRNKMIEMYREMMRVQV